ncbi:hypothetical protein ACK2FO_20735 [Clostridioides difficile]
MAASMNSFNLPDMRKYTKNIAFDPFAGGGKVLIGVVITMVCKVALKTLV